MKFTNLMKKDFSEKIQIAFRIAVLFITVFYFVSISFLPEENDEYYEVNLSKKFDYEIDTEDVLFDGDFELIKSENTTEPIELPADISVPLNQKVSVRSFLPDDYNEDYIIIRSSQENISIFIDGKARVIYNTENSRPFGSQTTSRYVFCRTSSDDAGKELRITVSSSSPDYSCRINEVYIGDRFIFWKYIFQQSEINIVLGFISVGIGVFIMLIGFGISKLMSIRSGLENAGWCISFVGLWVIGESKIRQLFTPNASSLSNICFIVIMLGAIPFLIYMNLLQRKRYERYYNALLSVAVINIVVQFTLQLLNVSDFLDMLFLSHIILVGSVIAATVITIIDIKKGYSKEYKIMVIGLSVLLTCLVIEVGSVYFVTMVSGIPMIIGIVAFTFCSLFDAIYRYKEFEKKDQEEKLRIQKEHSDSMTMQMIKTLSDTLEAKDEYTKGHSYRVAEYSALIAKKLGLSDKEIAKLHYAASLHDIGKIGIPDTILNKPSKLSNDEYSIIKTHTVIGADIINGIDLISYTEDVARYHHERYDGKGYPNGLSGENIPFFARIVAVADSYDAMSSKRIYRKNLSLEYIRNEIEKNKGLQFDPHVASAFLELFDAGEIVISENNDEDMKIMEAIDMENVTEAGQVFYAVMNTIKSKAEGGSVDYLTGLMLRNKGESVIGTKMVQSTGALMFFDMDNLKTVNDLYGHKVGDVALKYLGELLSETSDRITAFRAGGDEFIAFYENSSKEEAESFAKNVILQYSEKQKKENKLSKTSISVGIYLTLSGDTIEIAMNRADKALYHVKKSGKNGYEFYNNTDNAVSANVNQIDLDNLISSIKTAGMYSGSLSMEYREFTKIYEYIVKVCKRYEHSCNLVLVTIDTTDNHVNIDDIEKAMDAMGIAIRENIRNVDVCTRYSSAQYLIILLEAGEDNIDMVMQRVFTRYFKIYENAKFIPSYKVGNMRDE